VNIEHRRDRYRVSTDAALIDVDAVHAYLTRSYWAEGIPLATVARAIAHSIPFGLYHYTGSTHGQELFLA
jgi:hypothetical protein